MKEETINDKAQDYVSRLYAENEYPFGIKDIEIDVEEAFVDGAQWRINSVWHETSELPSRSGYLAVLCHNGIMETIHHTIGIGFQEMQLKGYSKWAYVDDLLPYGKEVTE